MESSRENILLEIEQEVTEADIELCKKQLKKPDRIGKYSVLFCIIIFSIVGFFIAEAIVDDSPVNHPWYSYIPFVGKHLWTAPIMTKLPLIGQYIEATGIFKFLIISVSILCGFLVGEIVSALIRNGAIQDERNKLKYKHYT